MMVEDVDRLRDINFDLEYRSDRCELASALFEPCLSVAASYDRAAGYFTSSGLVAAARGLERFLLNNGAMRLVAAPLLRLEDVEAIVRGYAAREDVIQRAILRGLMDSDTPLSSKDLDRLALLSWLVSEERLDVRLAIPSRPQAGIFHEKCAIFSDGFGDVVAVAGSPNETQGGLVDNFEAVDVFLSWSGDADRVARKVANFDSLWKDDTSGLDVLPVPDAVLQQLIGTTQGRRRAVSARAMPPPPEAAPPTHTQRTFRAPEGLTLRDYQLEAVEDWWLNDFSGILAMATGTGKTITALSAATDVYREMGAPLVVVVLAPYIHLVDQWDEEIRKWGVVPIRCYESSSSWTERAGSALRLVKASSRDLVVLVSTHATASLPAFKSLIRQVDGSRLMVIADEVHRLGAEGLIAGLPPHARLRLGLSATPERPEDEAGNQRLIEYFDGIVFDFGIADAIRAGQLTPYEYFTQLVELERDELEDYEDVVRLLEREMEKPEGRRDNARLTSLLNRRSGVLNGARGKLARLRVELERERPSRALIYTAHRRQLAAVMDLCWDRGVMTHQFTGEESRTERRTLLGQLEDGTIPALVAIRCLDEGVDVPSARQGYLLKSSGNPREFVQRRGRLLRLSPGKDRATIKDYVVIPGGDSDFERQLLMRELERVMAFGESAMNGAESLEPLIGVLDRFGLRPGGR